MTAMHPVVEQTFAVLAEPLAGCPAEALLRHPGGNTDVWSAWQVIDHLSRTWTATSVGIAERLQKGRPLQTRPSMQQRIGTVAVCRLGYFPNGRKAPGIVVPAAKPHMLLTGDMLAEQMRATLTEMNERLSQAEQNAGRARFLTHPVLGPLSIADWRLFHRAHARHHAPQLQRAVRG